MKQNNNLIKLTNTETGEYKYFTKDSYVYGYIGCGNQMLPAIKNGTSKTYKKWKYEIVDGSKVMYKDINNI